MMITQLGYLFMNALTAPCDRRLWADRCEELFPMEVMPKIQSSLAGYMKVFRDKAANAIGSNDLVLYPFHVVQVNLCAHDRRLLMNIDKISLVSLPVWIGGDWKNSPYICKGRSSVHFFTGTGNIYTGETGHSFSNVSAH